MPPDEIWATEGCSLSGRSRVPHKLAGLLSNTGIIPCIGGYWQGASAPPQAASPVPRRRAAAAAAAGGGGPTRTKAPGPFHSLDEYMSRAGLRGSGDGVAVPTLTCIGG